MKNILEFNLVKSDKFVGELPVKNTRRESVTPKIVVCPPMEEMTEPIAAPRGGRLLRALSRRLTRRAADSDSLASSSSSDSVACDPNRTTDEQSSCSTSESGSDGCDHHRRHRSTVSLRRVFQSLNLTSRSQSCSPTERQRPPKKQTQPKRILRPPVTYTYVRGLSGLPTQRVPRRAVYCPSSGLHR